MGEKGPEIRVEMGEVFIGVRGGPDEEVDDIEPAFYTAFGHAVDTYYDVEDLDDDTTSYR